LTLADLVRWTLAAVLLYAAAAKLRAGSGGRAALRSYGLGSAAARAAVWGLVVAAEGGLAVAVAAGVRGAAEAAAALLGLFALALLVAVVRGRAGAPCGCFGARSRIGRASVARTALLGAGFASLLVLPEVRPAAQTWLAIGLVAALIGIAALATAVLALARELGEVRLALPPQAALSLEHEGPELGSRVGLIDRFERPGKLALAVFTSPSCRLCRALEPALALVAANPEVELELFDEERDASAWRALNVPGSPYGVVLDPDGTVLAKGTFNNLPQLDGLLAAAGA
jgi:hypothetical protein